MFIIIIITFTKKIYVFPRFIDLPVWKYMEKNSQLDFAVDLDPTFLYFVYTCCDL